jgi:hypothetical protein
VTDSSISASGLVVRAPPRRGPAEAQAPGRRKRRLRAVAEIALPFVVALGLRSLMAAVLAAT